ncbi:MAG: hypothetical protein ACU0DW_06630 [Shimia sp.]
MRWLDRHAQALQALGALVTGLVAVAALFGAVLQIQAQDRIAQAATAHGLYKDFLALGIDQQELATPGTCPAFSPAKQAAYEAYLEYLFFTAEQVTTMDDSFAPVFEDALTRHLDTICTVDWSGYTPEVDALLARVEAQYCADRPACD